jgi:transcriptional regulator with XRE-family HTH domain
LFALTGLMDTLGTRLKAAREAAGLTQQQLAERVGMSGQQAIQAIETGKSKNPTKLVDIARACGVTPEFLLGREVGAPLKTKADRPAPRFKEPRAEKSVPEYDLRAGASYAGGRNDRAWNDESGWEADEPVENWGLPSAFVERELGLHYGFTDIIQVRGDSMDDGTAKGLVSGDRVIIDRQDTDVRQGGVFAVFDGDGVIVKQVELVRGKSPARILCKSKNAAYDPIPLDLVSPVRIIGRVAGVISRR